MVYTLIFHQFNYWTISKTQLLVCVFCESNPPVFKYLLVNKKHRRSLEYNPLYDQGVGAVWCGQDFRGVITGAGRRYRPVVGHRADARGIIWLKQCYEFWVYGCKYWIIFLQISSISSFWILINLVYEMAARICNIFKLSEKIKSLHYSFRFAYPICYHIYSWFNKRL